MGCAPIFGPGNKTVGFVCSRGRRAPPAPGLCSACGATGSLLCDGPGQRPGRTCNKPLCADCAISIRSLDVDFCRAHVEPVFGLGLCPCSNSAPQCQGMLVERAGNLCLAHAVLFDHWLGWAGGLAIYRDPRLSHDQRRGHFKRWLQEMPPAGLDMVLVDRHLR